MQRGQTVKLTTPLTAKHSLTNRLISGVKGELVPGEGGARHQAPPPLEAWRFAHPSGSSTQELISAHRQPTRRGEMWMRAGKRPRSSMRLRVGSRRRVIFSTSEGMKNSGFAITNPSGEHLFALR